MNAIKSPPSLRGGRSLKIHRWSLIIGNLLEHFDSALYGFLAPLLGRVFFPDFSPLYQLILAYGVYVITFLARPLGGIVFSKLTYRYGPFRVLLWSLIGVAMATGLMGFLPGAHRVGLVAPCLLISIRGVQSFCAAGESAIAGYYLIEKVPESSHLSWSGVYQSSTVLGILMASSLSTLILSSPENEDLWRLAFFLGFVLGLWALWLRFHSQRGEDIVSSPSVFSYEKVASRLITHWKLVVFLIPIYGFSYVMYSVPFVFLNPFLAQTTALPLSGLMHQTSPLLWIDALLMPGMIVLIQRFRWHKTLFWCAFVFAMSSCLLLAFLPLHSLTGVFLLRLGMILGGVGFTAALMPWTASLYPPRDKYLLHSVSYNMGSEFFGRSTPAICLWLYALTHHPASPLLYILGLMVIALGLMAWLQVSQVSQRIGLMAHWIVEMELQK